MAGRLFNVLQELNNAVDIFDVNSDQPIFATVTFPVRPSNDPDALRTDPARVAAVRDTQLLDTAPEEIFDRLTALTARLLNVPVTFLALVDSDRDYHKSRHVFGKAQQADLILRGRTFCHYTMASPTPVVIADATKIPLYRDIATVREQGVRAFAGVPLTTLSGQRIGTFCAVDFQPREWTESDLETLTELAQAALREIGLRQALRHSEDNAQAARAAVRIREEVLAVVAHDLLTPLDEIKAGAEVLAKIPRAADDNETTQRVEMLQRMQHAAGKMQGLVTDLLEVSKVRQGRNIVKQSRIAPHELLRDAKTLMQPIAQRRGITIVNNAQPGPRMVMIDYERMLRVLANIIGNGIKTGTNDSTISLHALHDRTFVTFTVSAASGGVATGGARARIAAAGMEPADRTIIEAHGGRIDVPEAFDEHANFIFTLPAM